MTGGDHSSVKQRVMETARPKEGIYASSVSSNPSVTLDQGRAVHQDLGLTLSPGLQISAGQHEGRLATPGSSIAKNVEGTGTEERAGCVRRYRRDTASKDRVKPKSVPRDGEEQNARQQGLSGKAWSQKSRVPDKSPGPLTKKTGKDTRGAGTRKMPATVRRPPLPRTYPREDDACYLIKKEHRINPLSNADNSMNQRNEDVNFLSRKNKQPGVPADGRNSLKRRREIENVDSDENVVSPTGHEGAVVNPTASSMDRGLNKFSPQPPNYQPLCSTQDHFVYFSETSAPHTLHPQLNCDHPVLPEASFDHPRHLERSFDHPLHQAGSLNYPLHSEARFDYPLYSKASSSCSRLVRSASCPPSLSRYHSTDMPRKAGNYKPGKYQTNTPWPTKNVPPYLSSPAPSQSPYQSPLASSQSTHQSPSGPSQSPSRRGRTEALSESPSKRPRTGARSSSTNSAFPFGTSDVYSQQNDGLSSFQVSQQAQTFPSGATLVNPSTHRTPFSQAVSTPDGYNQRPCSQPIIPTSQQFNPFSSGMSPPNPSISATPIYQGASTSDDYYQQPTSQTMLRTPQQASTYPFGPSFVNPSINDTRYTQGVSDPHSYNEQLIIQTVPRTSQQAHAFPSAPSLMNPFTHGTPPHQAFSPMVNTQRSAPHENPMSPPTTSNTTPQRGLSVSQTGRDTVYSSNPSGSESASPIRQPEPSMNKKSQARLDKALINNERLKAEVKSLKEEVAKKSKQVKEVQQGTYIQGLKQTIKRQNEKLAKKDEEIAHWKQSSQRFENMVKQWQPPIASTASVLANYGFDATNRAIDSMGYRPSVPSQPISLGHRAPLFHSHQRQPETIIITDDDEDVLEDAAAPTVGPSTVGAALDNDGEFDFSEDLFGPPGVPHIDFSTYDFGPTPDFDLFNQDNSALSGNDQVDQTGPTLSEPVLPSAGPVDARPLPTTPASTIPQEAAPLMVAPRETPSQEAVTIDEAAAERERRAKEDVWLAAINANENLPAEWRYDTTRRIQMNRDVHDMREEEAAREDAEVGDEVEEVVEGPGREEVRTREEEAEFLAGLEEEDAYDYLMGNGAFPGLGEDFPVPNLDDFDFGVE